MQTSIIILCILALFCLLFFAMLLLFFYKNGERVTKAEIERKRLEQQTLEIERKIEETYRRLYFESIKAVFTDKELKDEDLKAKYRSMYFEKLEKLIKI